MKPVGKNRAVGVKIEKGKMEFEKSEIVSREDKILTRGLNETNSTIMYM